MRLRTPIATLLARRAARLALCTAACAAGLYGCGGRSGSAPGETQPTSVTEAADPPGDFTLGVTVLAPTPATSPRTAANAPTPPARRPARRPARYVMESDRVLRVAIGDGVAETTFPTQTRRLTRLEVARLWGDVASAAWLQTAPGVADSPPAAAAPAYSAATPSPAIIIDVSGGGKRRRLALAPSDAGARRFVERLASWGWATP